MYLADLYDRLYRRVIRYIAHYFVSMGTERRLKIVNGLEI